MKSFLKLFFILLFSLFITCTTESDDEDPNVIGGETNLTMTEVGNKFYTTVTLGGKWYEQLIEPLEITKNENGVVTVKLKADLSQHPELQRINEMIPDELKDGEGKIDTEIKYKITSEGIQDYFNRDRKAHTLVKYDCNVGDQYRLTKSNGVTITRTVKAKSEVDDWPLGPFLLIKTILIEQDSRIPGVEKIVYRANHKFGLVYAEVIMEDGTAGTMNIESLNY